MGLHSRPDWRWELPWSAWWWTARRPRWASPWPEQPGRCWDWSGWQWAGCEVASPPCRSQPVSTAFTAGLDRTPARPARSRAHSTYSPGWVVLEGGAWTVWDVWSNSPTFAPRTSDHRGCETAHSRWPQSAAAAGGRLQPRRS